MISTGTGAAGLISSTLARPGRRTSAMIGRQIDQRLPDEWRWQGRRVRLVDGTTVTMPDTPENQAVYPQLRGQKEGLGFPIVDWSALPACPAVPC
ncbi:hypothetical protein [endosymbiont of Lamellibrachia barhami]|uniref:hypothetical protein n=1 Tax=endosymbiont of Lamellibrachia barhami TaxID=205975 RepID=UPI0015AA2555|nr:hypothetical protein [endosymbiont of Lamellibrachia barhami]